MNAYDAVFLAVAAGMFLERPRWRWLAALVPLASFAIAQAPLGMFRWPAVALVAFALSPRTAPVALLLALPSYATAAEAVRSAILWPAATMFFEAMEARLKEEAMPERLRGAPARLVVCAALYHALLPVAHL